MLSQYELDRLDNIARNRAVLEALGLEDGLTGKSKEKPKARAAAAKTSGMGGSTTWIGSVRSTAQRTARTRS